MAAERDSQRNVSMKSKSAAFSLITPTYGRMHFAGKRLKGMYRHLGASDRAEANLALNVLAAIAARGPVTAGLLLHEFDWEHKVLGKLAKPVKCAAAILMQSV